MAQLGRGFLAGLAVGIGAGLILPIVAPGLGRAVRPRAKAAVKAGMLAYDRARVALAELREQTEDMVAEASVELMLEREAEPQAQSAPRTASMADPEATESTSADRERVAQTG